MKLDISKITDYLYVSSRLHEGAEGELKILKVDLIISMIGQHEPPPHFGHPPFQLLWLRAYDTFLTPVPMRKLRQGVEAAAKTIDGGGRVLVFCNQGKRRSVTMACAILISQGYTADEAMDLVKEKRDVATPRMFYVKWRIKKFERYWKKKAGPEQE